MNKNSQNACIAIWLKQGNTITPLEALNKFGCFRLGARIADLRKAGYDIDTKMVEQNGKRFAQYTMKRKCCNCAYADFRYNDAPVGSGESTFLCTKEHCYKGYGDLCCKYWKARCEVKK